MGRLLPVAPAATFFNLAAAHVGSNGGVRPKPDARPLPFVSSTTPYVEDSLRYERQ